MPFKLEVSVFAHKNSQNKTNIPEAFRNYLIKVYDVHLCNTRYASNLNFFIPNQCENNVWQTYIYVCPLPKFGRRFLLT